MFSPKEDYTVVITKIIEDSEKKINDDKCVKEKHNENKCNICANVK